MAFIDPNYRRDVNMLLCNRELVIRAFYIGFDLDGYQFGTHEFIIDCRKEVEFDIWWNTL